MELLAIRDDGTKRLIELPQPLLTILKAHEFPPTTLRFNPTSDLLVSGSPDNTVRIVTIPTSLGNQRTSLALQVPPTEC